MMFLGEAVNCSEGEIKVSFGYHCNCKNDDSWERPNYIDIPSAAGKLQRASSSFSRLSGAALSANATLANTNICNGLIGSEILPTLDSPNSFRRIPSSPKLDFLSSSLQSGMSNLSFSPSSLSETLDYDSFSLKCMSAPSRSESFLNAMEVQIAGGAAGEDRVQAVCSEENGWLFCAIYDGFNGRDAADFLAGTLYERIAFHLNLLDWGLHQEPIKASNSLSVDGDISFKQSVLNSLQHALSETETEFLHMVEQEMDDRPDLVSIGSCVLLVLLHGKNLYLLNVGDSRAVLATYDKGINSSDSEGLRAIQLTDGHTVDNEVERVRLLNDHPDDPSTIVAGKVKGKLKVTRAFGVGYLKKKHMNDALMGILRVRNLISPPYVSLQPSISVHEVSNSDHFVVLGSDGLFDFFSNDEVVKLVHSYILRNPYGDPAKFLFEQLAARAADSAGFSIEQLMSIPAGRRRKYHDDVTVIVIVLGTNKRTSKASTCL
ncbi:Protein phosphatase 2C/pyruvate dehydrogenase (lipoamide) phosphatase [Handroanthus impetiginosus]|uniref:Protein phosphatase 2C/pyruvate dehydrogenase (Lipoamide) phosphatase n=1 Tax=Handroanthus impetiginosus TaxID=429701 RepID=A0A2G9G4U0_9LAMI|nr:Protein phosphatase 2C/pyruvate dehydrogenase (lipoamide) phosphatase [Handroanthus impetiginosus]